MDSEQGGCIGLWEGEAQGSLPALGECRLRCSSGGGWCGGAHNRAGWAARQSGVASWGLSPHSTTARAQEGGCVWPWR